jgi:glycosyltransferase involved in cell wall biosynthesis
MDALRMVGAQADLIYTSRFATTERELGERRRLNAALTFDGCDAVLGIDGEGWLWAPQRKVPYVAFCEAVLIEVLPFEDAASAELLRVQAEWEAAAARQADAVVARSAFAAGRVASAYGVPPSRIVTLPIPFDFDAWQNALPALAKAPLVLAVGHLYPRKNYAALLDAWRIVARTRTDARLVIVGDGPERARLHRAAKDLPSVTLAGHLPFGRLLELYARAGVFCHPSLQENFGIAPVEGLASGANVVLHEHPALLENAAGLPGVWAVDARRPENLARALVDALAAPAPPAERLQGLRAKLDPLSIGLRLKELIQSLE